MGFPEALAAGSNLRQFIGAADSVDHAPCIPDLHSHPERAAFWSSMVAAFGK